MTDRSTTPRLDVLATLSFAELRQSITTAHDALQRLSAFQLSEEEHTRFFVHKASQTDGLQPVGVSAPAINESLAIDEVTNWTVDGVSIQGQTERPSANTADPPEDRWYAVTVGRDPGVVRGVHNLMHNTSGVPGAVLQRYPSKETAAAAYHEALMAGQVVRVQLTITRCTLAIISDDESESDGQD